MPLTYKYEAFCKRVIDGDTIEIIIRLGFNITVEQTIRLYGINAPEIKGKTKEKGIIAKTWLINTISLKQIIVETFKDTEKYGRYLGIVYINNTNINQEMIKQGYAVEYIL